MADIKADVNDELFWDLPALVSANPVHRSTRCPGRVVEPFANSCPSVHVNLGECNRKRVISAAPATTSIAVNMLSAH
jgi:hypothetical protein